jgi:hypothetical protein
MADMDSKKLVPGHDCNCAFCKSRAPAAPLTPVEKLTERVDVLEGIILRLLSEFPRTSFPVEGAPPEKPVIPGWIFNSEPCNHD